MRGIIYYEINKPEDGWQWCYSAQELENILNNTLIGQKVLSVFVNLAGYLATLNPHPKDAIDLTYLGGQIIVLFEKDALVLNIYSKGVVKYELIPEWLIKKRRICDKFRSSMITSENYYFDLKNHQFSCEFTGLKVTKIEVYGTDSWGLAINGFDEIRAEGSGNMNQLPHKILFYLEGGVLLEVIADEFENSRITIGRI